VNPRPGTAKHGPGVFVPICICLWAMAIAVAGCSTRPVQVGQHAYTFEQDDLRINYLLFLPEGYGRGLLKRWPLIVFLHGSGERGSAMEDLERLKAEGLPRLIAEQPGFDALTGRFVVLSPQCPSWYWKSQFDALDALLDHIQATHAIDPKRIYLTGLSMGGFGAWHYGLERPHSFAALVPIAGGYEYYVETVYVGAGQSEIKLTIDPSPPESLCDLKDVPVWVFHGGMDVGIPHEQTADVLVDALQACGGNVRHTLYPGVGHDAWTETYHDPALYTWLLAQQRPRN
jgi:predicted peptidase